MAELFKAILIWWGEEWKWSKSQDITEIFSFYYLKLYWSIEKKLSVARQEKQKQLFTHHGNENV